MTDPDRIRRLALIAEAIDQYLPPDWAYVLIVGDPEKPDTANLVGNTPIEVTDELLKEIAKRHAAGERPKQLPEL